MSVRHPECRVDGILVIDAEIQQQRYQSASSFQATLSITEIEQSGGSLSDFTDSGDREITITGSNGEGFGGGGGKPLIQGRIDTATVNWERAVVTIEGRDATGKLIDKNVDLQQDQFKNRSEQEVIQQLASSEGLSAQVDEAAQRAGRKHVKDEYDLLTHSESKWNAICKLAERAGKVCYVQDGTLYVEDPRAGGQGGSIEVHYQRPSPGGPAQGEFIRLTTSVNHRVAGQVKVQVKSWHTRDKKEIKGEKQGSSNGGGGGQPVEYHYELPGLTQEQADRIAQKKLAEHTRHGKRLSLDIPGDVHADVRGTVNLSGTGTIFDDTYDIDSIRHIFDGPSSSYRMTVDAKIKGASG